MSFVTDNDLRYIAVINPIVLGDESFFVGRTPREILAGIPGSEEVCAAYEKVMATGETVKCEIQIENVWLENILRPTDLPSGERGVIGIATDITRQKILLREQAHRTKNAFTMAMAMANHTARGLDVPVEFKSKLHARLAALSLSQDAVSKAGGCGTSFQPLIEGQMGHAISADPTRFQITESNCFISADLAQYVTLAIYELYTNAVKYGSLSTDNGIVKIGCSNRNGIFEIVWEESGGPIPDQDSHHGFGRALVTSVIPKAVKGEASFDLHPTGLVWKFRAPQCTSGGCISR